MTGQEEDHVSMDDEIVETEIDGVVLGNCSQFINTPIALSQKTCNIV